MFPSTLKKEVRSLLQAALAACGVGLVAVAARGFIVDLRLAHGTRGDAATSIPAAIAGTVEVKAREQPLRIDPIPGLEDVVTESQAVEALCASLPNWNPPTVTLLLHELRLWGPAASFSDRVLGIPWSGAAATQILLSDKLCNASTVPGGGSYLLDSPFGIRVVRAGSADAAGSGGEGHHGQLLMVLGEARLPLSTPIETESGRLGTVADLLRDATVRFTLSGEGEFMAVALAFWLAPESAWTDRLGAIHSFDDLLGELLLQPYGKGACGGCHTPYAVTVILRCDDHCPILSNLITPRGAAMARAPVEAAGALPAP
ncbi:MAG TPA: hypothetical protein VNH11_27025 [Pirellulales bacterium]|nr:hypothetical protein [Pirellulales bacterium]